MTDAASDSLQMRKAALRTAALERRDALEIDDRLEWDVAITERVIRLLDELLEPSPSLRAERSNPDPLALHPPGLLRSARNDDGGAAIVSAYWPMRSEADPRPILEALAQRGTALCLPAIVEKRMIFRRWAPYEPIVPGGFGTLVPDPAQPQVLPKILIVPLAAFDRRGYRIGYGRGYYDRALSELGPTLTIGIGYAAQEIEAVPAEPHDQRLDWIVTDRGTLACG